MQNERLEGMTVLMTKYQENIDREWSDEPFPQELFDAIKLQEHSPLEAISVFKELSEHGSILSLLYLGDAYANGRGVESDVEIGLDYYERAGNFGSIEARHRIAYRKWCQDKHNETINILEDLSDLGFSPASYFMGLFYMSGNYINKDVTRSMEYFKSAERKGHLLAQRIVSIRLRSGEFGFFGRIMGYLKLVKLLPVFLYISLKKPDSDRVREW